MGGGPVSTSEPHPPQPPDSLLLEMLAEPTRRDIYDTVRRSPGPMTRDAVAGAVGIGVRLAAFHLDRLAGAGLLAIGFARPEGRSGPGAGRPAKHYSAAQRDVEIALPPRRYHLVARILAAAVASAPGDASNEAHTIAETEGRQIGAAHAASGHKSRHRLAAAATALESLGYEPRRERSRLCLGNCPFDGVVDVSPGLVCGLNERLVQGVLDGLGLAEHCRAELDGVAPDCCVTVHG
jgi:predicted ArsR family transcriptional regulator